LGVGGRTRRRRPAAAPRAADCRPSRTHGTGTGGAAHSRPPRSATIAARGGCPQPTGRRGGAWERTVVAARPAAGRRCVVITRADAAATDRAERQPPVAFYPDLRLGCRGTESGP